MLELHLRRTCEPGCSVFYIHFPSSERKRRVISTEDKTREANVGKLTFPKLRSSYWSGSSENSLGDP